jgi:membrane associated rhomboid family serine protease
LFIPLHDTNPLERIRWPYVTWTILALNLAVYFLFQSGVAIDADYAAIVTFGLFPEHLLGQGLLGANEYIGGPEWSLVTYSFLHGGWMHLLGNMVFLYVFGDNIEDAMGHWRFLVFYLACAALAGLAHAAMDINSQVPLIGASGAIAGIIGAYLMLHPRVKVWVLVLARFPMRITARWVLGGWIVYQFISVAWLDDGVIAWWAHIGGFLAGVLLVIFLRKSGVPLFDKNLAN